MPIQLSISETCEEIRHLRDAATDLLDPSGPGVLSEFERSLQSLVWSDPGHITDWQLFEDKDKALTTDISKGEFCFNGKVGEHDCFARISSIWSITPVRPARHKKISAFEVVGKASVHVRLFELVGSEEHALGSWRMELGDPTAPGCFFHTQILAEKDRTAYPFPHSLDIPRLPNLFFTPMAVTEFVLSELFQEKWRSPERQVRSDVKGWARIQRDRMLKMFMWHIRQSHSAPGSPWMHIKSTIPEPDWFLRTDLSLKNPSSFLKERKDD